MWRIGQDAMRKACCPSTPYVMHNQRALPRALSIQFILAPPLRHIPYTLFPFYNVHTQGIQLADLNYPLHIHVLALVVSIILPVMAAADQCCCHSAMTYHEFLTILAICLLIERYTSSNTSKATGVQSQSTQLPVCRSYASTVGRSKVQVFKERTHCVKTVLALTAEQPILNCGACSKG